MTPQRQDSPVQLVVHGFVGKATEGNWHIGPQAVFRPTYLLVWGKGARLSSFNVAGQEQLVYDPVELVPVDVIEPAITPETVLELTSLGSRLASVKDRLARGERIVLIGEPLRMKPPAAMNGFYPTCAVADRIQVEWQGELQALLVVGQQIV